MELPSLRYSGRRHFLKAEWQQKDLSGEESLLQQKEGIEHEYCKYLQIVLNSTEDVISPSYFFLV